MDRAGQVLHTALVVRCRSQLGQHLELADPEVVLGKGPLEGHGDARMLLEQCLPLLDESGVRLGHAAILRSVGHYVYDKLCPCTLCMCMYCRSMELTSPPDPRTADATRWSRSLWATLVVLCGVLFLDALDVSMVGMALPSIQNDLHLTTGQLQWVVSGYVLGYGGLLLLGGRAADLLGRRRVLLGALGVFVV